MKLNPAKSSVSLMLVVGLCLTASFPSHAATITKANNADALNLPSSWVGGVVPTSSEMPNIGRVVLCIQVQQHFACGYPRQKARRWVLRVGGSRERDRTIKSPNHKAPLSDLRDAVIRGVEYVGRHFIP